MNRVLTRAWRTGRDFVRRALDEAADARLRMKRLDRHSTHAVNSLEIRVVGLRRSGNHAIISWIRANSNPPVLHLNDLHPEVNPIHYAERRIRDRYPQFLARAEELNRERRRGFSRKECLILSYEDWGLEAINGPRLRSRHDLWLGSSGRIRTVLILRDPFNLVASRLKAGILRVKGRRRPLGQLWLEYADEFGNRTRSLGPGLVPLLFNRWVVDAEYREELAGAIGLSRSDLGMQRVATTGGGSSFDGLAFDGRACQMDLFGRWRSFCEDGRYRTMLAHPGLAERASSLLGLYEPEGAANYLRRVWGAAV